MIARVKQQGYFLLIAIIFILVIGVMGSAIVSIFAARSQVSVAQQGGLDAFYVAESGLEIATRILSQNTLACGNITGNPTVTNAVLSKGAFTVTATNDTPIYAISILSSAITAASVEIPLFNASSFASQGRIIVDKEVIDYNAISGNSLVGITRGVANTIPSTHAANAPVSQFLCQLNISAGVPNLSSPRYQRRIQTTVAVPDAWAVGSASGSNFVFTRFNRPNEQVWNYTPVAGGSLATSLNAVSMLSNADGWAVGNEDSRNFIILHYNGSNWTLTSQSGACTGQHLLDVSAVSSLEAWAVGVRHRPQGNNCNAGQQRFTIRRWNGSTWSALSPPTIPSDNNNNQNLNGVHVIDISGNGFGDIGFAVGNAGEILRYNGSVWTHDSLPTTQNLFGVFVVSTLQAWAVGAGGVILRWNGSSWSTVPSPTTQQLNDLSMLDTDGDGLANFGIAVGNSGALLVYNGTSWSGTDVGGINFLGCDILNRTTAGAVGSSGAFYRWDGNSWSPLSSGTSSQLNHISVVKGMGASGWKQVFE